MVLKKKSYYNKKMLLTFKDMDTEIHCLKNCRVTLGGFYVPYYYMTRKPEAINIK